MADDEDQIKGGLSAGGAIFGKLKALGVDYVFANSGTDFPPIIEGLIEARRKGLPLPVPVTVPHEMAAVSMAHGHAQMSGRAQAVMLHTNVGLSNAATAAINAACDQIPVILMSGRTPVTEQGRFGARTVPIGWGQEMFDQTALVREASKWDYELRFPEQVAELFDRGWAIANSTPKGPVYLSLPREVLCEDTPPDGLQAASSMAPVQTAPRPEDLTRAAALLAQAEAPLIISQRGAGSQMAFDALPGFVTDWALPVSHYWANQLTLPLSHPMQIGWDHDALLAEADVILVINSLAPWWPDKVRPKDGAKVIQLGPDPLFGRTPVRNFRADVTLGGETGPTLLALIAAMQAQPRDKARLTERRQRIAALSDQHRTTIETRAQAGNRAPMTKDWVSLCLGQAIRAHKAQTGQLSTVFHELGAPLLPLGLEDHLSYFQEPQFRRAWLGFSGGAWRTVGRARQAGLCHHGRRQLHVREPHCLPSGGRGAGPAGDHARAEQRRMGGGAPVGDGALPGRAGGAIQRGSADLAEAVARFRSDRTGQPRLYRNHHRRLRPARRARPRHRGCDERRPTGPVEHRHRALTLRAGPVAA